jgi:ribosomal protein L16 Arg81 hydroxylase
VNINGCPNVKLLGLDWLLWPTAPEDFSNIHWERRAHLITRSDPSYFSDLPCLDDLDELIVTTAAGGGSSLVKTDQSGTVSHREVHLNEVGVPDIHQIYRSYHDGYSIVINQMHLRSAQVAALCGTLEEALHHPVGANLYLTPQSGQGFRPHIDTHDVFILQLSGSKEWHVGKPANDLPLAEGGSDGTFSMTEFQKYTLNAGDTLYVPRGFPHEAVATAKSSLHLTVGIYVNRWTDLISQVLRIVAADQVLFRKSLPIKFLDAALDPAETQVLAKHLASAFSDDALMERAKWGLGAKLFTRDRIPSRGNFHSLDSISELGGDSMVARLREIPCRVHVTPKEAVIDFANNYVSGPLAIEPALRYIACNEYFAVTQLPGDLSIEDKVAIIERLIREGLLRLYDNSKGENNDF